MKKLFLYLVLSCTSLATYATSISGADTLCVGATTRVSGSPLSGTYSSSNTTIATVTASDGIVTGVAPGVDTITFTSIAPAGTASMIITVNPAPAAIMGNSIGRYCDGSVITLTDATTGGIWASNITFTAAIDSFTGITTLGGDPGPANITYTIIATGCFVSTSITSILGPEGISREDSFCTGSKITLTDLTTPGTWSSSNTVVASVGSSTGVVAGVSGGTATITYTDTASCIATSTVTVIPLPCVSGINEISNSNHNVQVYPNPVDDVLNIDGLQVKAKYLLQNITGATVRTGTLNESRDIILLQGLSPGMYVLQVEDDDGEKMMMKIIKE